MTNTPSDVLARKSYAYAMAADLRRLMPSMHQRMAPRLLGTMTTINVYDSMNRLVQTTDANGGVTVIEYDPNGRQSAITDANGHVEEVRGEGVVGEQPYLKPGEGFQYTSGAVLKTPVGTMSGSYQMVTDDGNDFDAQIPEFILSSPRTLH